MPSRPENREICSVMFVFYGTLTSVGTTFIHDIHVGHTWRHDKNDPSASLEILGFARRRLRFTHPLPQKCTIHRSRFVFVRSRKTVDVICACELWFDGT